MEPGDTSAWKELPFLAEGLLTVVGEVRRTLSYNGTVEIGACGLILLAALRFEALELTTVVAVLTVPLLLERDWSTYQ